MIPSASIDPSLSKSPWDVRRRASGWEIYVERGRTMFVESFRVESPRVRYGAGEIESEYRYDTTEVVPPADGGAGWVVRPKSVNYNFKTSTGVPKLGCVCIAINSRVITIHHT